MDKIRIRRVLCMVFMLSIGLGAFSQNKTWTKYTIGNSFSIDVPSTLELRSDNQAYSQMLNSANIHINSKGVVFQQKGLGDMSTLKSSHYCRIIIERIPGVMGDYYGAYETVDLNYDLRKALSQMALYASKPWTPQSVTHTNTVVNGYKAIKTTYYRQSASKDDITLVRIYILQNKDEMVKVMFSYKKSDANLYADDLNKVIRSFKWISINY